MEAKKPNQCPSCGKQLQEDFNVCPFCGKVIKIICAKCGKELKEEYAACPYCGEKVKGKSTSSNENRSPSDFSKTIGSILAAVGAFFVFLGKAARIFALTFFDWLKSFNWGKAGDFFKTIGSRLGTFAKKVLSSLKSLNWGKSSEFLKTLGGALAAFTKKAFSWTKQVLVKVWIFLKGFFFRLRDFLSSILEKKLAPDVAKKAATGIIAAGGILGLLLVMRLIFGGSNPSEKPEATAAAGAEETSIEAMPDAQPVVVDPSEQKWLVMVYADADDENLENDIYFDLNEAESAGSTERVQIVAQIDRFTGGYAEDGDWTGARRYFVTQDDDLGAVHSELAVDLGEVDMGSAKTLVDFAIWAIETYPADRYVLILSDHGAGWPGGWTDEDSGNPYGMALNQIDTALGEITAQTGINKFELVGMDACLMGMLEVYSMLEPHARYAVASEETEPSMGWAYGYFLKQLTEHPEMDGAELSSTIVDSYVHQDLRFKNAAVFKELLADYNLPEDLDEEYVAGRYAERITLSAIDLSALTELNNTFNQLILAIKESDQSKVAEARSYAQPFLNIFNDDLPSPFIDLRSFLNFIAENNADKTISGLIKEVETAYDRSVIAEAHGGNFPGATGISIYFPVSQHYWEGGNISRDTYPVYAERFSESSLWDDFLAFHYAGQDFGQGIPPLESRAIAPGYSEITVSPPVISPGIVSVNNPKINIQADITGDRIAYIYIVSMYRHENRLLFYEYDYLLGDENYDLNGVVYPYYERVDGAKHVDLDYDIYATAVTDGKTAAFAVLEPDVYGLISKDTIYSVKGFYVYSETGRRVSATMYFYNDGDNEMRNIIGYYGSEEEGITSAEIVPKKGDQFQFIDTWWVADEDGDVVDQLRDGNILTFGDQPFQQGVATQFVYPGEYFIAVGVEDMDGNQTFSGTFVTVE